MSSRSIRRVLGETHIERKCRLLFGACLLVLMVGTFSWVYVIAKNLVIRTTRSQARDLVDTVLLKVHWEVWETTTEQEKELVRKLAEDFKPTTDIQYEVLTLSEGVAINEINARRPQDDRELEILKALDAELTERTAKLAEASAKPVDIPDVEKPLPPTVAPPPARPSTELPYKELSLPGEGTYLYYQPIVWSRTCQSCHSPIASAAMPAALGEIASVNDAPLHVIKVTVPYRGTRDAINEAWAILLSAAIVTVFVAMVALYLIVRYVIVKPLKTLRDVSEQVREGNFNQQAEIHTNDEFEDLADSFNRMVRHLVDTQNEQRRLNTELAAKMDQLAQMNVQLHEMNRMKSEFLANMSHELRTPLNSIIGFSDVLKGIDSLNDKQKRYVQNIEKSGRVLLDMINDILDLAKLESNRMEVRPTEFRIEAVVTAQCDMVRSLSESKNIDLAYEISPELPPLFQDQAKIQQVLNNLLSNAIKFTPEGGRITISARRNHRGQLELMVSDTGVGIAPADREVIFEKFRQGTMDLGRDNLSREYSGTGLGLSIVKELCKLLGGEVTVESEIGKGSAFTVTLPWEVSTQTRRESPVTAQLAELPRSATPASVGS